MNKERLELRIQEICREALQRATPSEEERTETVQFSQKLAAQLGKELEKAGLEAEVQVEGSIAKDTWLAGEKDIDIFMLVRKTLGREAFTELLDVAKRVAGESYLEAYAEHPYIEAMIQGYTVDFVPCFKLEGGKEVASSVDRTPLHTLYVRERLDPRTRDEVRLLKRFMRGIGTYGAEIKVGGFSGYLCEVLTMHYGFFPKLLRAASNWREKEVIDLEGHYRGREEETRKIFQDPLIVVDPVDKGRNVGSAVRIEKLNEFIAASREFIKNPNIGFFHPEEVKALSVDELTQTIGSRGTSLIFLKTSTLRAVPDILWGQLYRSQRALRNLVCQYGFTLIRDDVWSDEGTSNVFLFELSSRFLPAVERHLGPPILKKEDCERFLRKHRSSKLGMSGPRIEGYRWVVERRRRYTDVVDLLGRHLKGGGGGIGVASLISQAFSSSFEIWVNEEVKEFYSGNPGFATFLAEYLRGRPRWLH